MQSRLEESKREEWREQVLASLGHLFQRKNESCLYGPQHAQAVEKAVLDILDAPEYGSAQIDVPVLQCAALLHDTGFAQQTQGWPIDCFEHIEASKQLASQILSRSTLFQDQPERIAQVLYLIEHHDDKTYSFPTATHQGRPVLPYSTQQRSYSDASLAMLQEADSSIHATDDCIIEASEEWQDRGVPLFASSRVPLDTWRRPGLAGVVRRTWTGF